MFAYGWQGARHGVWLKGLPPYQSKHLRHIIHTSSK
jgi:hypothetical protein